jgi:hypothetical protein
MIKAFDYPRPGSLAIWWQDIYQQMFTLQTDTHLDNLGHFASSRNIALGVTTAASFYGGVHLLAWNEPFRSAAERHLWRISSCMIAGAFPGCLAIYLMNNFDTGPS